MITCLPRFCKLNIKYSFKTWTQCIEIWTFVWLDNKFLLLEAISEFVWILLIVFFQLPVIKKYNCQFSFRYKEENISFGKKSKIDFSKKRKYYCPHCDFLWNAVRADILFFLIFILSYFLSFSFLRMSMKHTHTYYNKKYNPFFLSWYSWYTFFFYCYYWNKKFLSFYKYYRY